MILSGKQIEQEIKDGRIEISDFDQSRLGPNSYNLRLYPELFQYDEHTLDAKYNNPGRSEEISESGYVLRPGKFYLGRTAEQTHTDYFVPMLEGRSSIGRLGMSIHVTAGFGDIGFNGFWTLEIYVQKPLVIYPYMEICQIYFHTILGDIDKYDGKYQNNNGIQSSRIYKELQ